MIGAALHAPWALLAAGMLAGCANAPERPAVWAISPYAPLMAPPSNIPDRILIGRVVDRLEISTFEGDMELNVDSLMIEPSDAPGTRVTVLNQNIDCPRPDDRQHVYRRTLRPRQKPIWFRGEPEPRFASDWVIATCAVAEG